MTSQLDQKLVQSLLLLSENLVSGDSHAEKMNALCEQTRRLLDGDRCSIFLRSGQACWGRFNAGNPEDIAENFHRHKVPLTDPMVQEAFTFKRPVMVNNTLEDSRMHKGTARSARINAIVITPILEQDEPIGFITAEYNQRKGTFTELDATLLEGIARIASSMISMDSTLESKARLDTRVRELEKLEPLARLSGGLAHDFNNTLTVVNGYCELIQMEPESAATLDYIQAIKLASLKASNLARQLLTFSKGRQTHPEAISLRDILTELTPLLKSLLPDTITLQLQLDTGQAWIHADRSEFEQLIMNLILNGRDAISIQRAGQITVSVSSTDHRVVLRISDNGQGIEQEVVEQIFTPFFSTKGNKGMGLGLSNVKDIVERSRGGISVDTSSAGTTFTITLPEHEPGLMQQAASEKRSTQLNSGPKTLKVLLVDDQTALLQVQQQWLIAEGYQVLSTPNPLVARQWIRDNPEKFDVLVTDVLMPELTGPELAEEAVRAGITRIIFMSGFTDAEALNISRDDIQVSYLEKPFGPSELQLKIEQLEPAR